MTSDPAPSRAPGHSPGTIVNGLSVDIEDWFEIGPSGSTISRDDWDGLNERVVANIDRLLDLFVEAGVDATFFVQGGIARRRPDMIRRIVDAGHEIASHGFDHARIGSLDRAGFAEDIAASRAILEDCSGQKVTGYRAPSFSIDERTAWAFEELAEQGFTYSSSVAPVAHRHYGWAQAPRVPFRPLAGSTFVELPVNTAMLRGQRMPAGGGGLFRALPYGLPRWGARQANRSEDRAAVFCLRPGEIDPDPPRFPNGQAPSRARRRRSQLGLASRLCDFVHEFCWGRMDALAEREATRAICFSGSMQPAIRAA